MVEVEGRPCEKSGTTSTLTTTALSDILIVSSLTMEQTYNTEQTVEGVKRAEGASIASAIKNSTAETTGLTPKDVTINDVELTATRRLSSPQRQLLSYTYRKDIDYSIIFPASEAGKVDSIASSLSSNKSAFASRISSAYRKAEEERTGEAINVSVAIVDNFEIQRVTTTTTPAPTTKTTKPPTTTKTSTPTPDPTTAAPTTTKKASDEEEESNTGMIAGGVIGALGGVCCLGFLFYMWKKKNAEAQE